MESTDGVQFVCRSSSSSKRFGSVCPNFPDLLIDRKQRLTVERAFRMHGQSALGSTET